MKPRAPSLRQQNLSAAATFLVLIIAAFGQGTATAQTSLTLRGGQPIPGAILGTTASGVQFQTAAGTVTYPLANVASVQMAAPAEVAAARQAFEAKDYAKALTLAKTVADKFKGLPIEWAQSMTGLVGDLYVITGDLPKAEAAYAQFEKFYPGTGSMQAAVGRARIAAANKDFAAAKERLAPITEKALKEKNVPAANRLAYSGAFYVMGLVKESEKDYAGALEEYLRTITIFYHDATAVAAAQERADAVRKEHKVAVP